MSGLEVIGSVASVLQLAATVYSISKSLYEVGDALSNASSDIKDLARDLEAFSLELELLSTLLDGKSSRYSDQVYRLTAKLIGDCATICEKINRVLKKLRSGSVWSKMKWLYKEKEIDKLRTRLRDLKLSLMTILSHLSILKADRMMDAMRIGSSSLLQGDRNKDVAEETAKELEVTRKKLAGITMDQQQSDLAPIKNSSPQNTWCSKIPQATTLASKALSKRSPKTKSCALPIPVPDSSLINPGPLISCVAMPSQNFPGANALMMNPAAIGSVQSFQTALSRFEPEYDSDSQRASSVQERSLEAGAVTPQSMYSLYQEWKKETTASAMKHFKMTRKEAEAWADSVPMPSAKLLERQQEALSCDRPPLFLENPTAQNRVPPTDYRAISSFSLPRYGNAKLAPLTPMSPRTDSSLLKLPQGDKFGVVEFGTRDERRTDLTPVGEGVFRQSMGAGPMDPWYDGSEDSSMQMSSARIDPTSTNPATVHRYTPRYEHAALHFVEGSEHRDALNFSHTSGPSATFSAVDSPHSIHGHVISHVTSPSYPTELARVNMSGSRVPAAPTSSHSPFSLDVVTSPYGAPSYISKSSITQGGLIIPPRKRQIQNNTSVPAQDNPDDDSPGESNTEPTTKKPSFGIPAITGRTPIACLNCASSKTECDKTVPCLRCAEKNLPCEARFARRQAKIGARSKSLSNIPAVRQQRSSPLVSNDSALEMGTVSLDSGMPCDDLNYDPNFWSEYPPDLDNENGNSTQTAVPLAPFSPAVLQIYDPAANTSTSLPTNISSLAPRDSLVDPFVSAPNATSFTNLTAPSTYNESSEYNDTFNISPFVGNNSELEQGDPWYPFFLQEDQRSKQSPDKEELEVSGSLHTSCRRSDTAASPPSGSHYVVPGARKRDKPLPPIIVEDPGDDAEMKCARNSLAARKSRELKMQRSEELKVEIAKLKAERDHWKGTTLRQGDTQLVSDESIILAMARSVNLALSLERTSQLWWRALAKLGEIDPQVFSSLYKEWTEGKRHLPGDTPDHEVAVAAKVAVVEVELRVSDPGTSSILSSLKRVHDLMNVMHKTLGFKVGALAWFCISRAILVLEHDSKDLNLFKDVLEALADVAVLVARYNVMESMYQQWHGMTLESNYEDALISLCSEVLSFLNQAILLPLSRAPGSNQPMTERMQVSMAKIEAADAVCRAFSVTLLDSALERNMEDISDEDLDSDDTVCEYRGTKRGLEEASIVHAHPGDTAAQMLDQASLGSQAGPKRQKV